MIVPLAFEPHHHDHLEPIMACIPQAGELPKKGRVNPHDVALVPSYGALIRGRRMGYTRLILTQHGAGQSYGGEMRSRHQPGYPGGKDNKDVGLFLVPNEHAAKRWRDAYPKTPVAVVGCPKLEDLPHREGVPGRTIAVSWHWETRFSPEAGSAFAHFWPAVLRLKKAGYDVIGHSHPLRTEMPLWWKRHGIEYVPSFEDVCRRADLYVMDNSSTIFEFASTGRPVVLMNSPQYRKRVEHGLRFWEAANVGVQCDVPDLLPEAIERAFSEDWTARREAALDLVYAFRSGAAQRAADAVLDWAGPVAAVA